MDPTTPASPRVITVTPGRPIELVQFLKFSGLVESGGEAKHAVTEGRVLLNGAPETRKGRKLADGDQVTFDGQTLVVKVGA